MPARCSSYPHCGNLRGRLARIIPGLLQVLDAETTGIAFREAQARQASLAEHDSVLSLLAVLNDRSANRYVEKEGIVRAVVQEQQEAPHPLWPALLLAAFLPMLTLLRGQLVSALPHDELDALVVSSFLEAIDGCPVDEGRRNTIARLRSLTRHVVFDALKAEREASRRVLLLPPEDIWRATAGDWPEPRPPRRKPGGAPAEVAKGADFLVALVGDRFTEEELLLVAETVVGRVKLRTVVARGMPDASEGELERAYANLKRRHSRLLGRLRRVLSERGVSPKRDDPL